MKQRKKIIYKLFCLFFLLIITFSSSNIENLFYAENENSIHQEFEGTNEELNIHFFPLSGNEKDGLSPSPKNGDSCIIKVGNIEILVDAGVDEKSNYAIMEQMRKYCTDKVWDFIIVTHADLDHIGAFTTNNGADGVFSMFLKKGNQSPEMSLKTIIDFDITEDQTITDETYPHKNDLFTTKAYNTYKSYRTKVIAESKSTYYTASQCCWAKRQVSKEKCKNATNTFSLSENISLNILYNYYYDHKFNLNASKVSSADKNNVSVCFSINYETENATKRFLFTGDLEEFDSTKSVEDEDYADDEEVSEVGYSRIDGETKLIEYNSELKDGVLFYKAAHHGSRTSSSSDFIDAIRPAYVVIPAVAGIPRRNVEMNSESSYPEKVVTDRLFRYTDKIYIPSVYNESNKVEEYFGYISIGYSGDEVKVKTSKLCDSDTYTSINIQDTPWYKNYRESFMKTYVFDGFESKSNSYYGNCSLVKYGHYDILIDCGNYGVIGNNGVFSRCFLDKVKKYCVDGIIECLIVTSSNVQSISQLVDIEYNKKILKGVLSTFKVQKLIDFGDIAIDNENNESSNYEYLPILKKYKNIVKEKKSNNELLYGSAYELSTNDELIEITNNLTIEILKNEFYNKKNNVKEAYDNNVCFIISFYGKRLLFTGNISSAGEKSIVANNDLSNIVFFSASDHGYEGANSSLLLNSIKNNNENLYIAINSIPNENLFGKIIMSKLVCDRLINCSKFTYLTMVKNKDGYSEICGDIIFTLTIKDEKVIGNSSLNGSKGSAPLLYKTEFYNNLPNQSF